MNSTWAAINGGNYSVQQKGKQRQHINCFQKLLKMCCSLESVYRKDRMFDEDYDLKVSSSHWYSGRQLIWFLFSRIWNSLKKSNRWRLIEKKEIEFHVCNKKWREDDESRYHYNHMASQYMWSCFTFCLVTSQSGPRAGWRNIR